LLAPWAVAALLVNFLVPALFAANRSRLLNTLALPLLLVHLGVTTAAHALLGLDGAVGAFFFAPACFAVVLLIAGEGSAVGGLARELAGTTVSYAALCAVAFGASWGLGSAVGGFIGEALAIVLGCALYGAGLLLVAPRQVEMLRGVLARKPRAPMAVPASAAASAYTGGPA
jgi:hypothetical protein